jgi:hypothetical protein
MTTNMTQAQADAMRDRIRKQYEGLTFVMPKIADKSKNHKRGTPRRRKRRTIL